MRFWFGYVPRRYRSRPLSRGVKIMLGTFYLIALIGLLIIVLIVTGGCRPAEPEDNRPPGQSYLPTRDELPEAACRCQDRPPLSHADPALSSEDPRFLP